MSELNHAKVMELFADNLQHHTLPKSLGMPVLNKEQYDKFLAGAVPLFKAFRVSATVKQLTEGG